MQLPAPSRTFNFNGFVSRIAVNESLATRYAQSAQAHGGVTVRKDIANAKRSVTALKNFRPLLEVSKVAQNVAVNDTLSQLENLIDELHIVAQWSDEYQLHCKQQAAVQRQKDLAAFSLKRWGTNKERKVFEIDLVHELRTQDGLREMLQWLQSCKALVEVRLDSFHSLFNLSGHYEPSDRERNATFWLLSSESKASDPRETQSRGFFTFSWAEYNNYMEHRWQAAKAYQALLLRKKVT